MTQPVPPSYMAYDRTIVVFSPDGRLLQVEYARQAVKKGSTSVGIKTKNSVVLGAVRTVAPLGITDSYKKIYEIDNHIGLVSSGLLADARDLVDVARVKAQINNITYGESVSVSKLTKHVADRKHLVTQYAGVRPYGVGFLIGGADGSGTRLFETDPSGTVIEWNAQVIGRGSEKAKRILEKKYKPDMGTQEAAKLVMGVLKAGEKISSDDVEIAIIENKKFKRLSSQDIKKL